MTKWKKIELFVMHVVAVAAISFALLIATGFVGHAHPSSNHCHKHGSTLHCH